MLSRIAAGAAITLCATSTLVYAENNMNCASDTNMGQTGFIYEDGLSGTAVSIHADA